MIYGDSQAESLFHWMNGKKKLTNGLSGQAQPESEERGLLNYKEDIKKEAIALSQSSKINAAYANCLGANALDGLIHSIGDERNAVKFYKQ